VTQLRELARPFPASQIEQKPGSFSADYVAHHVVEQRIVSVLGRIPSQTIVREIYDGDKLTGVVMRMETVVDENPVCVEEAGDTEGNEKTNGARLKNASSDAYKRCCMRMTLGLHLWAQEHYWLDAWYAKQETAKDAA
jgi:hypothetical protein